MERKTEIIILLLILIVAGFFRLWQLSSIPPGLYPDEAINGNEAIENPGRIFYSENNGREGLFINLISLSFAIFSPSIWALRLVPAIIGIFTVLGLYLLTKELFQTTNRKCTENSSRCIALMTGFFLATSFWHINFSRIGFRAILLPFILVFSFYFLLKGSKLLQSLKSEKTQQNYGLVCSSTFSFGLAGLFFGLGFYTYTPFRLAVLILPFIFAPYYFLFKKQGLQKKFMLNTLYFILTTFIVALPLCLYFISHPQDFISRAAGISIFAQPKPIKELGESFLQHLAMFNFRGDPNWRHNFANSPQLLWPVGILFLIGVFISIKELVLSIKKKRQSFVPAPEQVRCGGHWSLVIWFFIMLLPGVLTYEGIPHALRVIGVIPVVYIFAALGGWQVFSFFEKNLANPVRNTISNGANKRFLIFAAVLFLLAVTSLQFDKYFQEWARRLETKNAFSQDYVKMGEYLNSLPPNIQKFVIVNQPGVPVPYPDGIPMPAQTIMFIQRTMNKEQRTKYLLPENLDDIKIEKETVILPMKEDPELFIKLWEKFPEGKLERKDGFWTYKIQ